MQFENEFFRTLLDHLNDAVYFVDQNRVVTFWNRAAEALTGFTVAEVVGGPCSDILRHVDENGRCLCGEDTCPAVRAMKESRPVDFDVYLNHKDGHRVYVHSTALPIHNQQGGISGAAEIFTDQSARGTVQERLLELEKMAMVDPLTGLANRRFVEVSLRGRLAAMERYGWPFGLLFIDIDRFKRVNDTYGHDVGDQVLRMVSKTLLSSLRPFDIVGRWGGEEFLAIILNTAEDQLSAVANRYRALIEKSGFTVGPNVVKVTVSIGATLSRPGDTSESLLRRADELLYRSKAAGRNRVSVRLEE